MTLDTFSIDAHAVDYTDKHGIKRRVLLPDGVTVHEEGIPVSLDVDRLFEDTTIEFRRRLVDTLWSMDLVEPCDFKRPGAAELVRAAIHSAIKVDTLNVITLATEECRRQKS